MNLTRLFCAIGTLILTASAHANSFTAKDFVALTEGQQHWWIAGAIEGIGHMVFLQDEAKAQCVWNWLPSDPAGKKALLLTHMKNHPDRAPSGILIILLQRECGKLVIAANAK